ncbi:hypothetical protein ACFQV2_13110 [Actinokineospora soli]|uniref:MacB-like periplasmic core domain-containing protein n=1 Tax=Actinokineospora soli TaxID=1048753 RepID=A0ABW2TP77_9PSEU
MTGLLAVKLRRDLRASWSRLLLMAVAIAVSLTAFGAVLFAWTGSARETRAAYLSTRPASATILLDRGIGGADMAALAERARTRPGVADAVGRTQFTGDVHVDGKLSTIPLQVFAAAPDDPLGLARFFPDRLAWPPAPGRSTSPATRWRCSASRWATPSPCAPPTAGRRPCGSSTPSTTPRSPRPRRSRPPAAT